MRLRQSVANRLSAHTNRCDKIHAHGCENRRIECDHTRRDAAVHAVVVRGNGFFARVQCFRIICADKPEDRIGLGALKGTGLGDGKQYSRKGEHIGQRNGCLLYTSRCV